MNKPARYGQTFFEGRAALVQQSAEVLVACMQSLFEPKSVVDVGCGDGAWLAEWSRRGVNHIKGFDGDWVNQSILKIPVANFEAKNLNQPLITQERFDLCTSFEVAEHLAPESAETFVASLTSLSDVVVFSAAIPGQGGTGHINEQWQGFWVEKFHKYEYVAYDAIAPRLWDAEDVQPCYLQNTMAFVKRAAIHRYPQLQAINVIDLEKCMRRVHPRAWVEKVAEAQDLARYGCIALLQALPRAISKSLVSRFGTR